jgi:hypothetical protein
VCAALLLATQDMKIMLAEVLAHMQATDSYRATWFQNNEIAMGSLKELETLRTAIKTEVSVEGTIVAKVGKWFSAGPTQLDNDANINLISAEDYQVAVDSKKRKDSKKVDPEMLIIDESGDVVAGEPIDALDDEEAAEEGGQDEPFLPKGKSGDSPEDIAALPAAAKLRDIKVNDMRFLLPMISAKSMMRNRCLGDTGGMAKRIPTPTQATAASSEVIDVDADLVSASSASGYKSPAAIVTRTVQLPDGTAATVLGKTKRTTPLTEFGSKRLELDLAAR